MDNEIFKMNAEQKLLLATGKLTLSIMDKNEIKNILTSKINWYNFLKLASYHKTLSLAIKNIKLISEQIVFPKYFDDLVEYFTYCTRVRNCANQKQIDKIQKACKDVNITIVPVKGAYLIPSIYKELGIRYSGDMDFLVRYNDVQKLNEALNNLGYKKGSYNCKTKAIDKISRAEEIKWKTYMSNLHPYFKLSDSEIFPFFKLDFRYALDDTLNKSPVNEIIDETEKNGFTKSSYYLIHLCTHFYDEAKHTASIAAFKDLNLIKLCDIREFIIACISDKDFEQTIEFSIRYNLENALYYTMHCMKTVYNEGFEDSIMNSLQIKDTSFLTLFGENTKNPKYVFSKTFWERFFSCGNYDELREPPKHFVTID